jgi:aminoglycoside 3-N-acetyltransferase I
MSEIIIKKLDGAYLMEFKELITVFRIVFEMENGQAADDDLLNKLLQNPSFICMVATINNKVVGGVTAYEMASYYGNYSEAYIYDIAVVKEYQRTGIGNKLIDALKDHCNKNNIKTIFVEANEEDTEAVSFYHRTKAVSEKVVHFNYYL